MSETLTLGGITVSVDVPAGPFVRVAATGVTLSIAGQTLTADVAFQQNGTTSLLLVVKNLTLRLGGDTPVLSITDGSGVLQVTGTTTKVLAGRIAGTVALNVPGVTLSGTLGLDISTAAIGQHHPRFGDRRRDDVRRGLGRRRRRGDRHRGGPGHRRLAAGRRHVPVHAVRDRRHPAGHAGGHVAVRLRRRRRRHRDARRRHRRHPHRLRQPADHRHRPRRGLLRDHRVQAARLARVHAVVRQRGPGPAAAQHDADGGRRHRAYA